MDTPIGEFEAVWPAVSRTGDLVSPVAAALRDWAAAVPVESVLLADTDPDKADTAAFGQAYRVPPEQSANCVVVAAKRGQDVTMAACVVLASTRADVNGLVRRHLGARKASRPWRTPRTW